jgi:hypothetical protein
LQAGFNTCVCVCIVVIIIFISPPSFTYKFQTSCKNSVPGSGFSDPLSIYCYSATFMTIRVFSS